MFLVKKGTQYTQRLLILLHKKAILQRTGNKSESVEELLTVVKDNFTWASIEKVIDGELINKYEDLFESNNIFHNQDVDNAFCLADGNSKVTARGNSVVWAFDNSTVRSLDNSTVRALDNSTVRAYENSKVIDNRS